MMRIIDLDATKWKTILDFYDGILAALGAPVGHGMSINALIDSMVWGGMNAVDPPYTIRIFEFSALSKDIQEEINVLRKEIIEASGEYKFIKLKDTEIIIETIL